MASEPVDNPFRNSAWPQMPQAPFRVGPLPRAGSPPPEPEPPPEPPRPAAITPLYVRPTQGAPAFQGLAAGGPTAFAQPRPVDPPPRPIAPEPEPIVVRPPDPAPEPHVFEVEPLVIEAPRKARPAEPVAAPILRPRARRRGVPPAAWAAGVVGVMAIAGLGYMFTRGEDAAAPVAPPVVAVAETPTVAATPTAPPPMAVDTPAATPRQVAAAPARTPVRAATFRATPVRASAAPAPIVAAATEEAIGAPVLSLPPAPATVAPEPPPPQPVYVPRTAPDPNAPISTQRPY